MRIKIDFLQWVLEKISKCIVPNNKDEKKIKYMTLLFGAQYLKDEKQFFPGMRDLHEITRVCH